MKVWMKVTNKVEGFNKNFVIIKLEKIKLLLRMMLFTATLLLRKSSYYPSLFLSLCSSKPPPPFPSPYPSSPFCSFHSPLHPVCYKQLVQVTNDMDKEENLRIKESSTQKEKQRTENFKVNMLKLRELASGFHIQFLHLKIYQYFLYNINK